MPPDITPVIITFDEGPNIGRVLARLRWAREVVVVDSGSGDDTVAIAQREPNVRVVQRPFDSAAAQWNFAVHDTGIRSEWVLALDADHVLGDVLVDALAALDPPPSVDAYRARFVYCLGGRALRGSLYPPREVLFRRARCRFYQDGHTQRLQVHGEVRDLPGTIRHDDRKPMERWLRSQWRYAREEAALIDGCGFAELSWSGRARKLVLPAPPLAFVVAWLARGGVLDGWAGLQYATERLVAEALISIALIRRRLGAGENPPAC